MPKHVDHEERRARISDALLRIAGTTGLHTVTMRNVAAEAGVSLRLVQYYFETKERLLAYTLRHLAAQMAARAHARLAHLAGTPEPRDVITAVLIEALPTDAESRTFHLVYTAYAMLALTDPALPVDSFVEPPNAIEAYLRDQLRAAQAAGTTAPGIDAAAETAGLLAMSAGLGTSVLLGQRTSEDAMTVLRYHLDRIFTP